MHYNICHNYITPFVYTCLYVKIICPELILGYDWGDFWSYFGSWWPTYVGHIIAHIVRYYSVHHNIYRNYIILYNILYFTLQHIPQLYNTMCVYVPLRQNHMSRLEFRVWLVVLLVVLLGRDIAHVQHTLWHIL